MPDNKKIQQALYDFNETIKVKDYSNEELLSKFPEFNNNQELLDAAFDYSATLNSGKYKSVEDFNDKFPELFDVKKKDDTQASSQFMPENFEQPGEPSSPPINDNIQETIAVDTNSLSSEELLAGVEPSIVSDQEQKAYEAKEPALSPTELRIENIKENQVDPLYKAEKLKGVPDIEAIINAKGQAKKIEEEAFLSKIKEDEANFKLGDYTKHYSDKILTNKGIDSSDHKAKSDIVKGREKLEYRGFLKNEEDVKHFDAINEIELLKTKIKETEGLDLSDKAKTEQINKYKSNISRVNDVLSKSKKEREQAINYKISSLSIDLNESSDDEDKKEIQSKIDILNSQKSLIFKPIKAVVAEISKGEEKKLEGETPQEQFNNYYDAVYEEYNHLKSKDKIQSLIGQNGGLSGALSTLKSFTYGGGDDDVNRFYELEQKLETLTPIRLLNKYEAKEDSEGFWGSAKTSFGNMTSPINRDSDVEQARVVANTISSLGVDVNKGVEGKSKVNYGLSDLEFWGSTIGTSTALMSQMMGSGAVLKGTKVFKYLDKGEKLGKVLSRRRYLEALSKSPLLAKTLTKASTKAFSFGKKAISAGATYEGTGIIFTNSEDEANYLSGLYGSVGEQTVNALLPQSRKLTPILRKMLGDSGFSKFTASVIKKGSSSTGRGLGEVSEEFMQEVSSIHREENADFYTELDNRFGTFDEASKFIVSSFVMGAFMGGGDNVSSSLHKNTKTKLEQLKKTNPEQAAKVEAAIKEINKESINALDESIDETKVKGEYKAGEVNIPYSDVEEIIDSAEEIGDLDGISINNDQELEARLQDKYKELKSNEDIKETVKDEAVEGTETETQDEIGGEEVLPEKAPIVEPKDIKTLEKENKNTLPKVKVGKVFLNEKGSLSSEERMEGVDKVIESGEIGTLPIEEVDVNDIIPTQTNLTIPNLESTKDVKDVKTEDEILVVEKEGKYFVVDGHHRIANDILKGNQKVKVRVYKPTTVKEEVKPTRLAPKSEYVTSTGNSTVKIVDGMLKVINNKTGNPVSSPVRKKAIEEYKEQTDYSQGEKGKITGQPTNEVEGDIEIARSSNNPAELIEMVVKSRDQGKEMLVAAQGSRDGRIAEALSEMAIERASLANNFDNNKIDLSIAMQYVAKKGEGHPIDKIAQSAKVSVEDVVNFVENNRGGVRRWELDQMQNKVGNEAEQRFNEITGFDIDDKTIEEYTKQKLESLDKSNEIENIENNDYAEDQFQEYIDSEFGETETTNEETEVRNVSDTPNETGKAKTTEKIEDTQEPKESNEERVNRVIKNSIDRTDLPDAVKESLKGNLKGKVLSKAETKKVAKQFVTDFDGTPVEAFEAANNSSMSEVLKTAIAIESLKDLKNQYESFNGNPEKQSIISKHQAEMVEIVEKLQEKAQDQGRAISYLTELYNDLSPEALEMSTLNKVEKLNKLQREKHNVGKIDSKDVDSITKEVLNSEEIIKLKAEIEALKDKVNDLESNNEVVKKERKKIKKHKENLKKIREEYKNSPDDLFNASIIPGLTNKGVQYAIDLSKEYISIGVSSSKILAEKLKAEFDRLGKNIPLSDLEELADEQFGSVVEKEALSKAKQKAKALETSIDKLFEDFLLGKDKAKVIETLTNDLGLTESQAEKLQAKIEKQLNKKLKDSVTKKMKEKLKDSPTVKNKSKRAKSIADKVVIAHEAGIDLEETIATEYDADFGILNIDNKSFKDEVKKKVAKVLLAKDMRLREKAENDLMTFIKEQKNIDWRNVLNSYAFANMLSGYNTHINNVTYGASAVVKEFISNAVKGFVDKSAWDANRVMTESIKSAWEIAKDIQRSGVEGDVKYETNTSNKNKFRGPNDLERVPIIGKLNQVLRALASEDEFFTTIIKEGKLTKILYEEALEIEAGKSKDGKVSKSKQKEILKDLNDRRYDKKEFDKNSVEANSDVTSYHGLKEPLMIQNSDGKWKLNPVHKGKIRIKQAVTDFKIRQYELNNKFIDPKGESSADAYEYAKQEILSGKPTGSAKIIYDKVNALIGDSPLLRILTIPFVKVPINSSKLILDTTPGLGTIWHAAKLLNNLNKDRGVTSESTLGMFFNESYLKRMGLDKGLSKERKSRIIKSQIMSTLVMGALYATIKGSDDEDENGINKIIDFTGNLGTTGYQGFQGYKKQMALKRSKGLLPYTVYIGGEPLMSYQYTVLIGVLGMLGNVRDTERGLSTVGEDDLALKWMLASTSNAELALDASALTGMREILDTGSKGFSHVSSGDLDKAMEEYAKFWVKKLGVLVPAGGALRQANDDVKSILDMPVNEVTKTYEYLYRGVPFLDNLIEDRTDFFGNKIDREVNLASFRDNPETTPELKVFSEFDYDLSNAEYSVRKQTNPFTGELEHLDREEMKNLRSSIQQRRVELLLDNEYLYDIADNIRDLDASQAEKNAAFKKDIKKILLNATKEGKKDYWMNR